MMIKTGVSFPQPIVEILTDTQKCEACEKEGRETPITLQNSENGLVQCPVCGHQNKIVNMEPLDETKQK